MSRPTDGVPVGRPGRNARQRRVPVPHRTPWSRVAFAAVKKQTVEARRNEILEVTCQVVIERGFAGTRISDVAKRLDVSSSLIHYHFDSKEQLLAEAFAHYARNDVAEMEAAIADAPNAIAELDRAIQSYVPEGSGDVEWMLWIDAWGEALRNPMMKRISQELDEQTEALLERVLRAGAEAGEFVCPSPKDAAMRLTALVDGLAVQFAAHDGMMDRAQLITHVRIAAAAEVGLSLAHFEGAGDSPSLDRSGPPAPATHIALEQLIARYCDGVIRNDADTWISTWTDDATWELRPGAAVDGRDTILATWTKAMKAFSWVVQSPGACVFEVDEVAGTGSGRITIHERLKPVKGEAVSRIAVYHDTYRRIGGDWRFAGRRLELID